METKPSVWDAPEVSNWTHLACDYHREVAKNLLGFSEYDTFKTTVEGKANLWQKIAFGMYGYPHDTDPKDRPQIKQKIDKTFDLVCKKNGDRSKFRVSFFIVSGLTRDGQFKYPILRLHLVNGRFVGNVFVDEIPRSYCHLDDYLINNCLPKCLISYPASGSYYVDNGDQLLILFKRSRACESRAAVLRAGDVSAAVVSGGSCLVVAAAALMTSAPVAAGAGMVAAVAVAASSTYMVSRSVGKLVDRSDHGQSIGLKEPEARNCWLAVGATAAAAAASTAMGAVNAVAGQIGPAVATAAQATVILSQGAGCLSVTNSCFNVVLRYRETGRVEKADMARFAAAVLFFGNVALSTEQTLTAIRQMSAAEAPTGIFAWFRSAPEFVPLSNAESTVFSLSAATAAGGAWHGGEGFAAGFRRVCKTIADATEKLSVKLMVASDYIKLILSTLRDFCFYFGREIETCVDFLFKLCKKNSLSEVLQELASANVHEIAFRLLVMKSWLQNRLTPSDSEDIVSDILAETISLQKVSGTANLEQNPKDWTDEFEKTCKLARREFERQQVSYRDRLKLAQRFAPGITESEFQSAEGITEPLNRHLWNEALTELRNLCGTETSQLRLAMSYLPVDESPSLEDAETGTTVSFFTGVRPEGKDLRLSRRQYFDLAREKAGVDIAESAVWQMDEASQTGCFVDIGDNARGIASVFVTCTPDNGLVEGCVFAMKRAGNL